MQGSIRRAQERNALAPIRRKRRDFRQSRRVRHLALAVCYTMSLGSTGIASFLNSSAASARPVIERVASRQDGVSRDADILAKRIHQRENHDLLLDKRRLGELGREIERALTRIRNRYPAMKEITARQRYRPAALLLKIEGDLLDSVAERWSGKDTGAVPPTGHPAFDDLNARLLLRTAKSIPSFGTVILHFGKRANLRVAREAFSAIAGVVRASFDERLGDGPDIVAAKRRGTWHVIMRKAWGDCPAGCINSEVSFFTVKRGRVERIEKERAEDMAEFWSLVRPGEQGRWWR